MLPWSCLGFPFELVQISIFPNLSCLSEKGYFEVDDACHCGFVATMHLFSKSLSIVLRCGSLLLNVISSYSSARCIRWPRFALIRPSCRCVIDVISLHCVCSIRLIRTESLFVQSASIYFCLSSTYRSSGCTSSI